MGVRFEIKNFLLNAENLQSKLLTTYQAMDYSDYNLRKFRIYKERKRIKWGLCYNFRVIFENNE